MPKTPLLFLVIALGFVCVSLQGIAEDTPRSRDNLPKIETSDAFNKLKEAQPATPADAPVIFRPAGTPASETVSYTHLTLPTICSV